MDDKLFEERKIKLSAFLESDEGHENLKAFFLKVSRKEDMLQSQLDRFHEKYSYRFTEILEKICAKYNADLWTIKWYKVGFQPPQSLLYFLFEYAKKYGRELTKEELEKHANTFTGEIYTTHDVVFNLMLGQGSYMKVTPL